MLALIPTVFAAGFLWVVWKVFGAYVQKSPLDSIPGPKRTSFFKGNTGDIFDRHGWDFHDRLSSEFPAVVKYHGPLGTRGLYVSDPKALNNIVVKEQHIYEEPRWFLSWLYMGFGPGLLSSIGDAHRRQRKMLNPVFSIAHMRNMTPLFYEVIHRLRIAVEKQVGNKATEVDVHNWMSRTALELVGQGGLGYSFDPLTHDARNEYGDAIKEFIPLSFTLHFYRIFYPKVCNIGTPAFRSFIANLIPSKKVQRFRQLVKTTRSYARKIYEEKKTALEQGDKAVVHQIGEGKDIISILMRANMRAEGEDKLPEDEVLAQMGMLVTAGTDTTTNALSRTFQLLAEHQDIQDKIRAELVQVGLDGADIPYDQLVDLPWLDAVCRETLRLYSPVVMMSREVRQDTVMPLSQPIQGADGQEFTEIYVPKDTTVIIGIRACNRNKAIWGEDALEWKPERWLNKLPDSVAAAHVPGIYSNLMTFLGGGRACIGFKFSQLEMKVVLAVMLRSFRIHLSDKTVCWNIAGVNYPTVGREGKVQAMPLRLEPLKKEL